MRIRMLPLLLLTMMLGGGCASDSKKKPTDPDPSLYLPRTSIANVLANLQRAYQEMSYKEYSKLLDDSFEYVFAPQDVGGENQIPATWGLLDELLSAHNMFSGVANRDHYRAEEIHLTFTSGPDTPTDLNPDWRKVVLSEVVLRIEVRHEANSDDLTYEVSGGDRANLYLVETTETEPGTNLRIWKIIRWEDKPIGYGKATVRDSSWGRIKSLFL